MAGLSLEAKKKLLKELLEKQGKNAPRLYPLSSGQKALWLLCQQDPDGAAYNTPFALRIRSEVDVPALSRAFDLLVSRHPCLRTTFSQTPDGQLVQTVHAALAPHFAVTDARGLVPEQLEAAVLRAYRRPFSLERGPLIRGDLFTVAQDDHVLLLTVHHIVYDGWSAGIIQNELSQAYLAYSRGAEPTLPPLSGSYSTFVADQSALLASPAGRAHLDYWLNKLSGELPELNLPVDRARTAGLGNRSGSCPLALDAELSAGVRALAKSEDTTPFVVLLSAYAAMLGRISRQEEVVVGTPTTGRSGALLHDVVGYFVNPVALRAAVPGTSSGRALIAGLRSVVHEALAHQDLPFASVVERIGGARKPGVSPVFQVSMTFQSSREGGGAMDLWATPEEGARIRWGHVELEPYPIKEIEGQFDLTLEMWEARGTFAGVLRYNRGILDASTVALWRDYLKGLLAALVATPDAPLAELSLTGGGVEGGASQTSPLASASETAPIEARVTTITAWFEEQVARTPGSIAVSCGDQHLSYAELDARANVLAHALQDLGVGPESLVGVCVDRTLELVIAILAVLKAGGAYVPLDPASPRDRLALILDDARVTALVTESKREAELPTGRVSTLFVDRLAWLDGKRSPAPRPTLEPHHAAYVIYTSGSTGRPKGVLVTHANVTRLFTATEGLYDFNAGDVWTLFHSAAFDFSVWELWGPLFYGGRLVVVAHWMTRSPEAFAELIVREGVTVLNQTPSAFRALLRAPAIADGTGGRGLRYIIFGGEALDAATVRPWFERYASGETQLINMYGITETTVHVTFHRVTEADLTSSASPIGRPIPDLELLLLDAQGKPVPPGVPGEIYVGGAGVARGYLERPELNRLRFIPDPRDPTRRLYRSGDLAIRQPDGTYNYQGRIDDQVKIRGFRIELGEIQALIAEHAAVAEAYVSTYERGADDRRIVAYVVPKEGASESVLSPEAGEGATGSHVGEWKELYDELYARSDEDQHTDPTFNIAGWNSSYSSAPLSAEAMREWVDHTVRQVLEREPKRVLEIGCGTGLLLSRIAPTTSAYHATDVSGVVVGMVQRWAKRSGLDQVKLFHCPADQLGRLDLGTEGFDAVVINSVVQYFPSGEYLARALEAAITRVRPGGFVFVGDVRNLRLLEAFHASIALAQSTGTLEPKALQERVLRRMAVEEELVLDPDFFWGLRRRIPRVSHVEIRPKRGACANELTRFRYDVVLHIEAEPESGPAVSWGPGNMSLPELRTWLSRTFKAGADGARGLGLRGLRSSRLNPALEAAACLTDASGLRPGAIEKLRRRVLDRDGSSPASEPEPGVDPEALFQLADALSLGVALDWSRGGADGAFDAVFLPTPPPAKGRPIALFGVPAEPPAGARRANDPLRGRLERRLETELRKKAQERLPDYMVPASIMVIDKLPLTENGKVDRRALPLPAAPSGGDVEHVDPRNGEEEILASVFAELLGAERVGVHQSFFDLGGHSLLATQVVSRIRAVFGVDLALRALFDRPTVAGLAIELQKLRARGGAAVLPLVRAEDRPAELPLSSSQERLFILDRVEETRSPIYIIPLVLRLRGAIDRVALEDSLAEIVLRHEALRTSFPTSGDAAVQAIAEPFVFDLSPAPLPDGHPGAPAPSLDRRIEDAVGTEVSRPFDLASGPLIRARLFRVAEGDHVLAVTMHHIISDGWSLGVFARELGALYNARHAGRAPSLPALPLQYADFAIWQRRLLSEGALAAGIEANKARLQGAPLALELPADRPRPAQPTFAGSVVRFGVERALTARLKELSRREGVTLYMTLLASFALYLSRLTGQRDLVLGSPVANRNRGETEPLIGFFVNTLALRIDLGGDPTFLELLARVRRMTLDAYADQDVPFEKVVEAISPERSLNRQPLVQAMFVLQNAPFTPPSLDGLAVELLELDAVTSKFDLTLSMQETGDGLTAILEYSSELFDRTRIERMAEHLNVVLASVAERPEVRSGEVPVLGEAEAKLLAEWSVGGPAPEGSVSSETVLDLFLANAARDPAAVALELGSPPAAGSGPSAITYGELELRTRALAGALVAAGVGQQTRVAIVLERSLDPWIAALAVWRAGAAYVPIDPDYPPARIEHMLGDCAPELTITTRRLAERLPGGGRRFAIDDPGAWPSASSAAIEPALPRPAPTSAAYVIYTSGSTGRPKGVVLEHGGLANIARAQRELFAVTPESRVLQFASFSFDASVWELVMALGSGARLVVAAEDTSRAGEGLAALLGSRGVTHATLPPSTLAALPDPAGPGSERYPALTTIISAGEACTRELVKKWRHGARRFFNAYGPTETTICATVAEVFGEGPGAPSIGRPLPGLVARILDPGQKPAPIGVPGELAIGGVGVGRGYLGLEELTRDRFIPDPLTGSGRLYRTGDLARWRSDGTIEYLGRLDHQVKLRGHRIELGEIEAVLEGHAAVQQALATVWSGQLAAYVIPRRTGDQPTPRALLEHARERLPDYMVPAHLLLLDAFPTTPNGKIDRARLPDPLSLARDVELVLPAAGPEQVLAEIWAAVLKKPVVGVHDNFFALGGDSILGLQIIARATQRGLRLRPRQLFQHQTIAELAKVASAETKSSAEQGLVGGSAPLTPIQRWFFEQERAGQEHFNMAMLLDVEPDLDLDALRGALDALEVQHDALRLRFSRTERGWEQHHAAPRASAGSEATPEGTAPPPSSGIPLLQGTLSSLEELHAGLDLEKGPVMRAAVLRAADGSARLALVAHHLVVDAVSWAILIEDLLVAHDQLAAPRDGQRPGGAPVLPAKTTSFAEWSRRLAAFAGSAEARASLDAWLATGDRELARELPLDDPKAPDTVGDAATIASWLDAEQTKLLLSEVPAAYDVKVHELLITALARSLSAWTGQPEVRIDLEGHGREGVFEDLDLSRTVGWFTALYPVRLRAGARDPARETLARVKDTLRRIPHGGVSHGVLRYLSEDPSVSGRLAAAPRPSVVFNYLGQLGAMPPASVVRGVARERAGALHAPGARRPHRLEVDAVISDGKLKVSFTFGAEVLRAETVERLQAAMMTQLRGLIEGRSQPAAAVRVAADFPAARVSAKDLARVLGKAKRPG